MNMTSRDRGQIYRKTATELNSLFRGREVSAVEITRSHWEHIDATESMIGSFLTQTRDESFRAARELDNRLKAGEHLGPLAGVPVGIKDNICMSGTRTTCASRMLAAFTSFYDATVVQKIRQADALPMGKLNMDEFAMGSSCENSAIKTTRNPWDLRKVSGGSSGGSAAAVSSCQLPLTLGTDTGGSIRVPASFCGAVGLKPTYGVVSRYGLVAFASSLDSIGPIGRTVHDVEMLFSAICGQDTAHDSTSIPYIYHNYTLAKTEDLHNITIGIPPEYFGLEVSADVREAVQRAIRIMETLGAGVTDVSLPSAACALQAYYILSSAEASSNLARFDGLKYGHSAPGSPNMDELYTTTRSEGFGDEVQRRILMGTYLLSAGYGEDIYKRAKQVQHTARVEFARAFGMCDLIATPASPTTAFSLGERTDDPLRMYAADRCTVPVNMAGLPAISLPCGVDGCGMPVGMQLIGPACSERQLLRVAAVFERAVGGFSFPEVAV